MKGKVITFLGASESGKTLLIEGLITKMGGKIKNSSPGPTSSIKVYGAFFKDIPFYFIDTPGEENFIAELKWAMSVSDLGVLVVDSTVPVKYYIYRIFEMAKEIKLPLINFINKIDAEKTQWAQTICDLQDMLEILQIPVVYGFNTTQPLFLVDLVEKKKIIEENLKINYEKIPEMFDHKTQTLSDQLLEVSAEAKDEFIEKYLEEGLLTKDELIEGIKINLQNQKMIPIFIGSAYSGLGVGVFFNKILEFYPERSFPLINTNAGFGLTFKTIYDPYAGKLSFGRIFKGSFKADSKLITSQGKEEKYTQIFLPRGDSLEAVKEAKEGDIIVFAKVDALKTGDTFSTEPLKEALPVPEMPTPMFTLALHPETRADEDKISSAISKIKEEDPSLNFYRDEETRELLISGLGSIHIEKTIEKLREKYGVKVKTSLPRVPYRETIKKPVQGVIYRHKKQSGGRGQFAEVHFNVFPLERGRGFEFLETLTGMNVPRNYVPAVEKGVREAMEKGVLAGFPVVDVKVQFYDGKSHEVDSSDLAFKLAAIQCFKKALEQASPTLLEPIIELEIFVPDETVGDVIGDLNSRRGRVLNLEKEGKRTKIRAQAPLAEMLEYVVTLNGLTGGRGYFISRFSHYEEAPPFVAEKVIASAGAKSQEE
ncbi:elongation factor G [Caldimicrobium thiodismutans]|uniref:Elongation factor G n=1 Tax=Caldimicrobium thiodismutans TaxID=1653476 RepID=A0A0U4W450_9BACT|nr:elongation factor G [Caldimicrobium thiodismutans]BAU23867.1 elongation factor G [Caldimicrobium thiodismutans]